MIERGHVCERSVSNTFGEQTQHYIVIMLLSSFVCSKFMHPRFNIINRITIRL